MKPEVQRIKLSLIVNDIDLQSRASISSAVVEEYAESPDKDFPPILVFVEEQFGVEVHDRYFPADGWHRILAGHKRGQDDIAAEIRVGTRRDAILFSCGANAKHGIHRTDADKRRAVQRLLDDPEWSTWSNVAIAKAAAVSAPFVLSLRKSMETNGKIKETEKRTGSDGRQYPAKQPAKPGVKRDNPKRDSEKGDAPKKPHVAPIDADMPEEYRDMEGNDVPESLFPVWQRLDDYMRIANRIRESGVTEALMELREIGVELADKETAVFADEAIEQIRLIGAGIKQRAPAFVRGLGWSSLRTEFLETTRDE
jgi:hypothetical protein